MKQSTLIRFFKTMRAGLLPLFFAMVFAAQSPAFSQTIECDLRAPGSRDASWSPDGKKIAFDSNRSGNYEIYTMAANGTNVQRLTSTEASEYYPFFSPDGKKIVFMSFGQSGTVIQVINTNGTGLKSLTQEGATNADPDWSPDGKKIVFYSDRDGNAEIYTMNADGTGPKRLTHTEANENTPSFSPDGKKILFISDRDGNAELYVMNADGSRHQRLTNSPLVDRVARWSPDGKKIIFYARRSLAGGGQRNQSWASAEIYTIDADGRNRTQVTSNNHLDQSPVWSPDGTKITFTSCRTGNREIFVMDNDGGNVQRLTHSGK